MLHWVMFIMYICVISGMENTNILEFSYVGDGQTTCPPTIKQLSHTSCVGRHFVVDAVVVVLTFVDLRSLSVKAVTFQT